MTHLRKMMLEELERRNYAEPTINCYIQTIEDFARYFRRPPDLIPCFRTKLSMILGKVNRYHCQC
jgi:hypothetical protein